jgi:hypothetical protein
MIVRKKQMQILENTGEVVFSGCFGSADTGTTKVKIFYSKNEDCKHNYLLEYKSKKYSKRHKAFGFDTIAEAAFDAGCVSIECDLMRQKAEGGEKQ